MPQVALGPRSPRFLKKFSQKFSIGYPMFRCQPLFFPPGSLRCHAVTESFRTDKFAPNSVAGVSINGAVDEVPRDVSSGSLLRTCPANNYSEVGVQLPVFQGKACDWPRETVASVDSIKLGADFLCGSFAVVTQ